jgi:DNA-directed RNA polymerase subunit RPC12/RpoP
MVLGALIAHAGDGFPMKCMDGNDADGQPVKGCGYEEMVIFGGGMMFHRIMGYCTSCKKFVGVTWTREGSPLLKPDAKIVPPPKPLGVVWDSATGGKLTLYACPHCKGPFAEIKTVKDLTHCPKCNEASFKVDPSKPRLAVD